MAARLWAETARNLAESLLLPLDVDAYASYLAEALAHFKLRYGDLMEANGVDLSTCHSCSCFRLSLSLFCTQRTIQTVRAL